MQAWYWATGTYKLLNLSLSVQVSLVREVESSRTYFVVLGLQGEVLGLEASSPRKFPCPRLKDSAIFLIIKILLENDRNFAENLRRPFLLSSFGDCQKKNFEDLFF